MLPVSPVDQVAVEVTFGSLVHSDSISSHIARIIVLDGQISCEYAAVVGNHGGHFGHFGVVLPLLVLVTLFFAPRLRA